MNPVDGNVTRGIVRWCIVLQVCTSLIFVMTQSARLAPIFFGVSDAGALGHGLILALVPVWSWTLLPSFMLATFIVAGSMAENGTMTALHAAGVSPLRISRWPAVIGVIFFGVSAGMSIWAVPAAERKFHATVQKILYQGVTGALDAGTFVRPVDGVLFFASDKQSQTVFNGVYLERRVGAQTQLLVAEEADIAADSTAGQLRIALRKGELFVPGDTLTVLSFDTLNMRVPIEDAIQKKSDLLSDVESAATGQLLRAVSTHKTTRAERFELYRRLTQPLAFLLVALLSIGLAFRVFWAHRYVAIGTSLSLFVMSQLISRGGAVWMDAGILSPVMAALLSPGLFLGVTGGWWCVALCKKRCNSLCKKAVSCR